MSVRARLIVAFVYIVVTVTIALAVPLGITLQRRAESELRANALAQGQAIAAAIERARPSAPLTRTVEQASRIAGGRVLVVDGAGVLVADSDAPELIGTRYATAERRELLTALRQGIPSSRSGPSETLGGREILATAVPITERGEIVGAVRISQDRQVVRAQARRALFALAGVAGVGLLAGIVLAVLLAASLARPLRKLADAARRAGAGDLGARAGRVGGAREIVEVASEFDRMAARVERTVQARERFAADASHQLRTPLTGLQLRLETAVDTAPAEMRPGLEAAEQEARRLGEIVERLLVLSRELETQDGEAVDLFEAAEQAVARWTGPAQQQGARITAAGESARATTAAADVAQMLDNLIDNALRYGGQAVEVRVHARDGRAVLTVGDDGPGIAPDERAHVLERFARGRDAAAGGSGLGLAIARELAERWGGSVTIGEGARGGTTVEIDLPCL